MRFESFRIRNYKSFRDTDEIHLGPGFNVFVGKNNSGKTALLECLSLQNFQDKPHRSSVVPRGDPLNPRSEVEFVVSLSPTELRRAFLAVDGQIWFPIPPMLGSERRNGLEEFHTFLGASQKLFFDMVHGPNFRARGYPSHGLFRRNNNASDRAVHLSVNEEKTDFLDGRIHGNRNDNLINYLVPAAVSATYSFRAERFSLGACNFGNNAELTPNAANLAEVLNILQGQPERFALFNSFVHKIFPTIRRVSVRPLPHNRVEIIVWNSDAPTDRDDLAVALSESGTGVGQVLAMLYIVMTAHSPQSIIIDEPNTFLHPGAVRALIEIMKSNSVKHQYVITTHSPEIIRATEAESVHLLQWQNEQSRITSIEPRDAVSFRRTLLDVGVQLSDLFGADHLLWVEGATEEECFPKILQASEVEVAPGLSIVAVRATGDFESRNASAVAIWEIYERLSTGGNLVPTTLAISLDREDRVEDDIARATERSRGLMHFLPRRCFENYLLHPTAIATLLNSLPGLHESPITEQNVVDWIREHAGQRRYGGEAWNGDINRAEWLSSVFGARLLYDLFQDVSNAREEYRKVEHGAALTQWICEHDLNHFTDLVGYLTPLCQVAA